MNISRPHLLKTLSPYLPSCVAAACAIVIGLLVTAVPHPVQASLKQAQAVGAGVFRDKGCQHCHGVDFNGTERGPDLSTVGKRLPKDRIEQQIRAGGDNMPAFGDVLQADEIKSLVEFLGAKRKPSRKPPSSSTKPASPAKPATSPSDDSGS